MPLTLAFLLALALLAPSSALGGGWATTSLSSTPDGLAPGQEWTVDLTVLQHGRTPLPGVEPEIAIRGAGGERRFTASPTDKVGVYRARVTFPRAGRWEYTIYNGFDNRPQRFPAVTIGGRAAVAGASAENGGGLPGLSWALGGAGLALLLASGATALRGRVRTA